MAGLIIALWHHSQRGRKIFYHGGGTNQVLIDNYCYLTCVPYLSVNLPSIVLTSMQHLANILIDAHDVRLLELSFWSEPEDKDYDY